MTTYVEISEPKNARSQVKRGSKKVSEKVSIVPAAVRPAKEFDDMGLKFNLLRAIFSYGFEKPSEIQVNALPYLIQPNPHDIMKRKKEWPRLQVHLLWLQRQEKSDLGVLSVDVLRYEILPFLAPPKYCPYDLLCQGYGGTGKTTAITISMLQNLDDSKNELQGLLLAPTRELAMNIFSQCKSLSQFLKFKIHCCVGGRKPDFQKLKEGHHIIVATPGRINSLIERKAVSVKNLKMLAIDQLDEIFSLGFKDTTYDLQKHMPTELQVCHLSATFPEEVLQFSDLFLKDPVKILIRRENITLEGIRQFYVDVIQERNKYSTLDDLYKCLKIARAIIFCNSRKRVEYLRERMENDDHTVLSVHSGHSAEKRSQNLKEFRMGSARVLITTDLMSRGIDIHQGYLVIQYDVPKTSGEYLRRIGRSGRYGRKGISICFVTKRDMARLKEFEKYFSTKIEPLPRDVNKYL